MSEIQLPRHMSYSQVTTYQNCGEQYRLSRVLHLPEAPAWALVGGTAVHKASEYYDDPFLSGQDIDHDDPKELFKLAFAESVAADVEKAPEEYKDTASWKCSGRASKAYPDKENEQWWKDHGPEFVGNWINWRKNTPLEIWRNDEGEQAIELYAEVEIAGFPVKVYIDRVMTGSQGLLIVDLKSGANMPKDGMQLGVYALAVKQHHGLEVPYGQFFDARKGSTSVAFPTSRFPKERLDFIFGGVRKQQELGIFVPHITNMCVSCGVNRFCHAYGGERSGEVEQLW